MEECCPLTNRDELPDVRPIITYFDSFRLLVSLVSSALVEPAECFNIGVWFKLVSLVKEVRNTLIPVFFFSEITVWRHLIDRITTKIILLAEVISILKNLYMHHIISIRGSVQWSVCWSVQWSVCWSVSLLVYQSVTPLQRSRR